MAYGRIPPFSRYPVQAGLVYPKYYNTNGGVGVWRMLGLGVAGSIGSNCWWELFWAAPATIPTGQLKLELWSRANATSGILRCNPRWAGVSMGQNPGAVAPTSEGAVSITWSAAHVVIQTKFILDADTLVAGQILSMCLAFEAAGTTQTAESVHQAWLIYE